MVGRLDLGPARFSMSQWRQDQEPRPLLAFELRLQASQIDLTPEMLRAPPRVPAREVALFATNLRLNLSDQTHQLGIGELRLSKEAGTVEFRDLSLTHAPLATDEQELQLMESNQNKLFDIRLPSLRLVGVGFDPLVARRVLRMDSLVVERPYLGFELYSYLKPEVDQPSAAFDLYQKVSPHLNAISLGVVSLRGAHLMVNRNFPDNAFVITRSGDSIAAHQIRRTIELQDFNIKVQNFELDSISRLDQDKIYYSDDIILRVKNFGTVFTDSLGQDSLYALTTREVGISLARQTAYVSGLHYYPLLDRFVYDDRIGFQTSVLDLYVDSIGIERFDPFLFLENDILQIGKITLDSLRLVAFKDMELLYDTSRRPPTPHQMVRRIPVPIMVDSIRLTRSEIVYDEYSPKTKRVGQLTFENAEGYITNITNIPEKLARNENLKLSLVADLMGQGEMKASFVVPLNSPNQRYSMKGELGAMKVSSFNLLLENILSVKLKEGDIESMKFNIQFNEEFSTGRLLLRYSGLEVGILENDTTVVQQQERGFLTFLANKLIQTENPQWGRPMRVGKIFYLRNVSRPVFNFWAHSLLSGIKFTFGLKSKAMRHELRRNQREIRRENRLVTQEMALERAVAKQAMRDRERTKAILGEHGM